MKFFKEKLKMFRESAGYTQKELAEKIGIRKQAVTQWESGETLPKSVRIPELAKVLRCSIADLCDLVPPSEADSMKVIDSRLSAVIDLWDTLDADQQSEIVGMVKAFSIENKKNSDTKQA